MFGKWQFWKKCSSFFYIIPTFHINQLESESFLFLISHAHKTLQYVVSHTQRESVRQPYLFERCVRYAVAADVQLFEAVVEGLEQPLQLPGSLGRRGDEVGHLAPDILH